MGKKEESSVGLRHEDEQLRTRLEEAEETLRALRSGEVDALVVPKELGDQLFTIKGADRSYRTIVEQMGEGAATLTDQGFVLYCNRQLARILRSPLEKVIGSSILDWIELADREAFQASIQTGTDGVRCAVSFRARDKTVVPALIAVNPLELDAEVTVVVMVVTDLTQQMQDEMLAAEGRLTRSILAGAADTIVVCDEKGQVIRASDTAHQLCGQHPIGRPFDAVFPLRLSGGTEPGSEVAPASLLCLENKQARRGIEATLEFRGETLSLLASVGPMFAETGSMLGSVVTLTDITDLKRAEEELFKHREHLEEMVTVRTVELTAVNKELEAFAYSVSHDLRAPLRSIDGFSKALLDDYQDKLDDTGRGHLNRVRAGAQRMAWLIDDLLKLSRLTRAEMRQQSVDLSELARQIAGELQRNEAERRVDLVIPGGITAHGDWTLLKAALENLLGNAWKFTALRQRARIELGVKEQNGERVYYVRDDGAGFDMAYADKLFGAFQRLHAAAVFPGNGIGLAIVKRVILRHGGRIWAEGEVDEGATFYFTLPTVASASDDIQTESETGREDRENTT